MHFITVGKCKLFEQVRYVNSDNLLHFHVCQAFNKMSTPLLYDGPSSIAYIVCSAVYAIVMPNTHRRRRRDATVELSRVGGVHWA